MKEINYRTLECRSLDYEQSLSRSGNGLRKRQSELDSA